MTGITDYSVRLSVGLWSEQALNTLTNVDGVNPYIRCIDRGELGSDRPCLVFAAARYNLITFLKSKLSYDRVTAAGEKHIVIASAAHSLAAIHAKGIVHNDIKVRWIGFFVRLSAVVF